MKIPTYTSADFLRAFLNLLPRGRAWSKDLSSNMSKALAPLMPTYERSSMRASNVVQEAFVSSTSELLPEWEASLGLPDACQGAAPTAEARRAQAVARFANAGGQSVPYLIKFAKDLGYDITITEYSLAAAGTFGVPALDANPQFVLKINATQNTARYFRASDARANDALSTFGNTVLECELRRIAPAHAYLVFAYVP